MQLPSVIDLFIRREIKKTKNMHIFDGVVFIVCGRFV